MTLGRAVRLVFGLAVGTLAFAQVGPVDQETPEAVTVQFAAQDSASFYLTDGLVTRIDIQARGESYTVPLDCVTGGGLRDVRFGTALLAFAGTPGNGAKGVSLLFERGREDERRFGELPRVQVSLSGGRVREMLESRQTSATSSFSDKLCESLPAPPRPLCAADVAPPRGLPSATAIVEQLRPLPPALPGGVFGERAQAESLRRALYEQLLAKREEAVEALAAALNDPDVDMRRNVALAFGALSGGWWSFECGHRTVDISAALPALAAALRDDDSSVRAWSIQAIGYMGSAGAPAVPALIEMLQQGDEAARNSAALTLGRIGTPARVALPVLRTALSDPSEDVRRFASNAIERIEAQ